MAAIVPNSADAKLSTSSIPTMQHGDDNPPNNLNTTLDIAKLAYKPLFNYINNEIKFDSPINGTLNDFTFSTQGKYSETITKKAKDSFCQPTIKLKPYATYDIEVSAKGAGDAISGPLVKSATFLGNTISEPDLDNKSTETINYHFDANIDLSKIKALWSSNIKVTGPISGELCTDAPLSWVAPSIYSKFDINSTVKNKSIKLPSNHPVSFTLSLELPSYNKSQAQNLIQNKYGVKYSSASYPEITDISIDDINTNQLISKIYEDNTFIQDAVINGVANSIRDAVPGGIGIVLYPVVKIVDTIFAVPIARAFKGDIDKLITNELNSVESTLPSVINNSIKNELVNSSGFKTFSDVFAKTITSYAWNNNDYPRGSESEETSVPSMELPKMSEPNNITGTKKRDRLYGNIGIDILVGGGGSDLLSGGKGADIFKYAKIKDSKAKRNRQDLITDFSGFKHEGDKIDLSKLSDDLHFIGKNFFSGENGQIRYLDGRLDVDINGDKREDFQIFVNSKDPIKAADLIMN